MIPSAKTLALIKIQNGTPQQLRKLLVSQQAQGAKPLATLALADAIIGGFGVEHLRRGYRTDASYVNMGETYETTLLYLWASANWIVRSWGDRVEAEERRGRRYP